MMSRRFTPAKKVISVILSVIIGLVGSIFLFSASNAAAAPDSRQLRVNPDGSFRILQIADLQDFCRPEEGSTPAVNIYFREMNTIKLAIARLKPNLIVLTGDNVNYARGALSSGMTIFEYAVQKIVSTFDGVPFVVTYGNHDQENNSRDANGAYRFSEAEQDEIYRRYGALPLINDISPGDNSGNSTAKHGTGYVNVYDAAGQTVVQRVILLNSGSYDSQPDYPSHYGRVGINAAGYTDNYNDYAKVVSAVRRWTSDPAIKCIAFQHIPLQEIFHGDSPETRLLVSSSTGYSASPTCSGSGISGNYIPSSANSTATGEFNEDCGCSYASTRDLFNALADKPNVMGIFFGHEHMNTIAGKVVVNGKSLVLGYGGGLLVDPADYVCSNAYAYNPLISAYSLYGNGLREQTFEETRRLYTYYGLLRDTNIKNFSSEESYISEVRLFAADTVGMTNYPNSYVGYFEQAKAKCIAAGYTPLETCYTRNTADSTAYHTEADFNFGNYKYGSYYSNARAVCLGYKTTHDPAKAITDIRIYDGGVDPPAKWTKQEIWAYQNNSQSTGSHRSTANNTDDSIPFYNANYDWNENYTVSTLRSDTNTQVRFCEGLTGLGSANNAWLYYTKDPQAGTPVKRIFADITDSASFSDGFNKNRFNAEYPYTFVQNLNATYDFDRDNNAFNVNMGYTDNITGKANQSAKGSWAYIGLAHAVESENSEKSLRANRDGSFRILQIADLQDFCRPEEGSTPAVNIYFREINTIKLAIARVKPNLIVLTGDNIDGAKGTLSDGISIFEHTVKTIVSAFDGVPFVVTYGNHDQETNSRDVNGISRFSEAEQDAIYRRYGALPLINDIVYSDASDNSTAKHGTGYVNVYDAAGRTVLQRVVLINTGTYEGTRTDPAPSGRPGINAVSYTDAHNDYAKIAAAVDRWTGDPAIKCIAFQHIPLQEIFLGDSPSKRLLVNADEGIAAGQTRSGSGVSGKYIPSSANRTVTGEYNEEGCCSYSSTRELFNALAGKPNVAGIFFGHDHMNTVAGRVTVNGKSLALGYGGSLLVDPASYSCCTAFAYNPMISAYTLYGDGRKTQTLEETKQLYSYYGLLRDTDIKKFSTKDTYISEVRLFAADTIGKPNPEGSYVGYFDEAKAKCIAAGYTPLETCYTLNTPGSDAYHTEADFNLGNYQYGTIHSNARAICLGYKTTHDPAKAITDIRIYAGSDNPPAKWSGQEIWAYQNNSKNSGSHRSTANDTDHSIPFYNANYDWNEDYSVSTLRADTNAQVKFCEGLTARGSDNNAWLFYTKDPQAGSPVKRIFADITADTLSTRDFNKNRFNTEYPYTFVQKLDETYDLDRDNEAFNVNTAYTKGFGAYDSLFPNCSWAYIGLVHAVESHSDDAVTPVVPKPPQNTCSHICHSKNPFVRWIWRIIKIFYQVLEIEQTCSCGQAHW